MNIKSIYFILVFSLMIVSCKKSDTTTNPTPDPLPSNTIVFNDSIFGSFIGNGYQSVNGGTRTYYASYGAYELVRSNRYLSVNIIKPDSGELVAREYHTVEKENVTDMSYGQCTVVIGDSTTHFDGYYTVAANQTISINKINGKFQLIIDNKRAYRVKAGSKEIINVIANLNQ